MASLKAIQRRLPGADTVAGRCIVYHEGKHYDLGQYVGEGAVILSKDGERLMAPAAKPVDETKGSDSQPMGG